MSTQRDIIAGFLLGLMLCFFVALLISYAWPEQGGADWIRLVFTTSR